MPNNNYPNWVDSSMHGFTEKQLRKLLDKAGFIKENCQCTECNTRGWHYVDPYGNIVDEPKNPENPHKQPCENCDAIGYHINDVF